MQIPVSTLEATHQQHFEAAKKQEKDPEGGPYPAYPSGAGFGGIRRFVWWVVWSDVRWNADFLEYPVVQFQ